MCNLVRILYRFRKIKKNMKYNLLIYTKNYGVIESIVEYDNIPTLKSNIFNIGTNGIIFDSINYISDWINEGEYLYVPTHQIHKIEIKKI